MSTRNTISGIVLAGIFVLAGFSACSEDKEAPQRAMASKGPDIALSDELRDVPRITAVDTSKLKTEGLVSLVVKGNSIADGAYAAKDAFEAIQKFGPSLPYKKVLVRLDENLVDKYGRESLEPLFHLTYDRADVEKMNLKNLTSWDILNFADVENVGPVSAQIARQECEPGSDNARYAEAFCAVATAN